MTAADETSLLPSSAGSDDDFPPAEPVEAEPAEAEPVEAEPAEAEPAEAEPAEAEPASDLQFGTSATEGGVSQDPDQPLLDIVAARSKRPTLWTLAAAGAQSANGEAEQQPPDIEEAAAPGRGQTAADEDWERARTMMDAGEVFEARVNGYNQGGVTIAFGRLRGFIPNSHLSGIEPTMSAEQQQEVLSQLVGKTITLRIVEAQRKRRRLVLSERMAERAWREKQRERVLEALEVGQVVTGKVRSVTSFGVFLDLGGADGLIHMSELSWKKTKNPREAIRVGQELTAKVIRVERERGRIGLSVKQLQANPWEVIEAKYRPGQLVTARVTNLVSFGAFASLEPGIEGLVHISELSDEFIEHPRQVVQRGQEYTMRVLAIDRDHERVSLSLKQAPQWIEAPTTAPKREGNGNGAR